VQVGPTVLSVLNKYRLFPDEWDVVLLTYHFWRKVTMHEVTDNALDAPLKLMRASGYGEIRSAGGYIVSLRGAVKLLQSTRPFHKPIDIYTGDFDTLNVYMVEPKLVFQEEIFPSSVNSRRFPLNGKIEKRVQEIDTWFEILPKIENFPRLIRLLGFLQPLRRIKRVFPFLKNPFRS